MKNNPGTLMADDANPGKTLAAFYDTSAMKWRLQKTGLKE